MTVRASGSHAGSYHVNYVDSDDSSHGPGSFGETYQSCEQSSRRYLHDPRVVAVIGPLFPVCEYRMVPALDRGGLALFGFLGSLPGFTHAPPVAIAADSCFECDPDRFYPAGTRNFLTTSATLDSEGTAAAGLLARRGLHRVAVVSEAGDSFLTPWLLTAFRPAARRLGLTIVAQLAYPPHARSFAMLAQRVTAAHPDGLYLLGWTPPANPGQPTPDTAAELFRAIRQAGFRGPIIGCLEMVNARLPVDARGVDDSAEFLSTELPLAALPARARRLSAALGPGANTQAAYAAAATEVALAAIAHSNGTRDGVREQMFHMTVNSLIGPISFDANGDVQPQRIAVFRVRGQRFIYEQTVTVP